MLALAAPLPSSMQSFTSLETERSNRNKKQKQETDRRNRNSKAARLAEHVGQEPDGAAGDGPRRARHQPPQQHGAQQRSDLQTSHRKSIRQGCMKTSRSAVRRGSWPGTRSGRFTAAARCPTAPPPASFCAGSPSARLHCLCCATAEDAPATSNRSSMRGRPDLQAAAADLSVRL